MLAGLALSDPFEQKCSGSRLCLVGDQHSGLYPKKPEPDIQKPNAHLTGSSSKMRMDMAVSINWGSFTGGP